MPKLLKTGAKVLIQFKRDKHCLKRTQIARGPLPWEDESDFKCTEPPKIFRKKTDFTNHFDNRPRRNTYEWVIEKEEEMKPYGLKYVLDKTLCEIRRFQKCMRFFHDEAKCGAEDFAPKKCYKVTKTYPLDSAVEKGSIPGHVKQISHK